MNTTSSSLPALISMSAGLWMVAALLYRIIAFWLPLPAAGAAYFLFQRRQSGSCPGQRWQPHGSGWAEGLSEVSNEERKT
jgi:hypothetical protein